MDTNTGGHWHRRGGTDAEGEFCRTKPFSGAPKDLGKTKMPMGKPRMDTNRENGAEGRRHWRKPEGGPQMTRMTRMGNGETKPIEETANGHEPGGHWHRRGGTGAEGDFAERSHWEKRTNTPHPDPLASSEEGRSRCGWKGGWDYETKPMRRGQAFQIGDFRFQRGPGGVPDSTWESKCVFAKRSQWGRSGLWMAGLGQNGAGSDRFRMAPALTPRRMRRLGRAGWDLGLHRLVFGRRILALEKFPPAAI